MRESGCWARFGSSWTPSAQHFVTSFTRSSSSKRVGAPNDKDLNEEVVHLRQLGVQIKKSERDRAVAESLERRGTSQLLPRSFMHTFPDIAVASFLRVVRDVPFVLAKRGWT